MCPRNGSGETGADIPLRPVPIPASQLASYEADRSRHLHALEPLQYGCAELDGVLLGGLPRGSIVGISSDDENGFGMLVSWF